MSLEKQLKDRNIRNHRKKIMGGITLLLILSACTICGAFTPKDHYLLSCGSTASNSAEGHAFDGRTWYPDQNATFSSAFSSTIAVSAPNHDPSAPAGIPFTAARIFNSSFTYTFPVSPGPLFLRLFFYPSLYSDDFNASQFFVTVQANDHLLLRNFSAQIAVSYASYTIRQGSSTNEYVVKEYYLTVPNSHNSLNLTFSPTRPSTYAFINGIELVSVPEDLYVKVDTQTSDLLSQSNPFQITISFALETAYRLNVGGSQVNAETDGSISGMYRLWNEDTPYLILLYGQPGISRHQIDYTKKVPNYTAPEQVYQTFRDLGSERNDPDFQKKHNLTWRFMVDPGFNYMLRLHWCEVAVQINTTADLLFQVYINNLTVESDASVLAWTDNQKYVPFYKDYIVSATGSDGSGGSGEIWVALHPSTELKTNYAGAFLNGLEIFKINKSDGGLDAPNPQLSLDSKNPSKEVTARSQSRSHLLTAIVGGIVAGVVFTSLLVWLLIFRRLKAKKESTTFGTSTNKTSWFFPSFKSGSNKTSDKGSTLPSHLCRHFSLAQIKLATNDFSEGLIIGHGGFGNVYKGMLDGEKGLHTVAIKRLNPLSKQGIHEFKTEIGMLSKLRHLHLVSLIGYCDDSGEMILVYEYMERGTLRDHLYNTNNPPLSWNQRLNACLGAAKGLHYLHTGASQMIIHRDVKSTNILLDKKWVSKVSDFGLSKLGPVGGDLSHVSTAVKGSFGYVDPEYYKFQRLTEKSDVYSFGVVLLEVLCGRAAVNPTLSKEQVNLAVWARSHQRKGAVDVIVDPNVKGEIAPSCLRKFGELAERCVRDHGIDRPNMADVVWSLEFAIELQEKAGTFSDIVPDMEVLPSATITVEAAATSATTDTTTTTTNGGVNFSSTSGVRMTSSNSSSALLVSSSPDYSKSTSGTVFSEIFKPQGR